MEKLFINILQMSISASYLILAVLIVRFLLRKAPKSMRSFLWLLVGIRLLVPFSVESVFSLIPSTQTVNQYIYDMGQLEKNTITQKETTDTDKMLSQPEPSPSMASVPSAGKNDNMRTAVLFCSKIWLLGAAMMLGYMLISWLHLKRRVRMAIPTDITLDCKPVKFYRSDVVESPFLFGIINPRIYIPSYIADEELPYVILHELTHRKRRDHFIKPAGFLLLSVYWFNPCVWIAYIMLCKDIELICDEKVIRQLGASHKKEYSQALLNSAVNRPANRRMIMACPIAFGGNGIRERVKNVLNYKKPAFWALVAAVLACIIVPVCFMTQKKPDTVENENVSHETNFDTEDSADTVEINLDDIFTLEGTYEMLVPDAGKYISIPRFSLEQNNIFSFGYDSFSSYMPYGTYELKDDILMAVTNDGKYRYQFTRAGDSNDYNNIFFRFDAEQSSDVTCTDPNADAPVTDGALFVRNTASASLAAAWEQSETLNQKLASGLAMTEAEFLQIQKDFESLKIQLTHEQLALQRKLEKVEELSLSPEEKNVLEARYQELIQELDAAIQQLTADEAVCQSAANADENADTASIAPHIITSENVDDMIAEDTWQLETLFPDHHEFAFNADFPRTIDLNGDGVAEKIEMINLMYNGGDGGYALRVTDTATGQQIPLPDGYTEEYGFPITAVYVDQRAEGGDGQLAIQLGDGNNTVTIATITQSALFRIYERNHLYIEVKNQFFTDEMIAADALSGCNIITYQKEGQNKETPVLLLKTYISGYAGHVDTLGYVITELRLQKDNTWASWHYFLLDSCDDTFIELQNTKSIQKSGALFLPFTVESDFDIVQLK